jgi:ketosteroid isomerase-like protein
MFRLLTCLVAILPIALQAQNADVNLGDRDVAAIAKLADDLARAVDAADANRIADCYSPEAAYFADGETPVTRNVGKFVASRWRKTIGSNRAHMAIKVEEVNVSGDLAYDRISYTVTILPRVVTLLPGQTGTPPQVLRVGRALEILRKEDGTWKYYRIMTNSPSNDE